MGKSYEELPAPVRRYIDQMRKREDAERLVLQGCIDLATERGVTVHDAATILSLELEGPQRGRFMTATRSIIEEHLDNVAAEARAAALRPKAAPPTERDLLAKAIVDAARQGGVWNGNDPPAEHLVALCADMGSSLVARRQDTDNFAARLKATTEQRDRAVALLVDMTVPLRRLRTLLSEAGGDAYLARAPDVPAIVKAAHVLADDMGLLPPEARKLPRPESDIATCGHANECPNVCPCPPGCYCRTDGGCQGRARDKRARRKP
jgi:hypothetical protein